MRIKVSSQAAFSFPEILVSAGILGFAISALIGFFINTLALNETSRHMTVAVTHADALLEEIRNASFSSLASGIGQGAWDWDATAITAKGLVPLKNEQITTTVSGSTLLTVTVQVAWSDSSGRARSLALTTMTGGV